MEKIAILKKHSRKLAALAGTGMALAMGTMTASAEDAAQTVQEGEAAWGTLFSTLLLPILLLVFLYFIMIRPQQKQEKATREMQQNLCVGDEVVTIGGIVGIVLKVNENTQTVVIETGSDHFKLLMKQDAIKENVTATENAEAEKAKAAKRKTGAISTGKPKDE